VTGVVSSYNDQLVLSGAQDGTLLLHSLSSSHLLKHTVTLSHTDTTSQGAITRLRFSVMDHAMAASASEKGSVCLWSVESQRMLHEFSFSSGTTTDLCFAQSNNKLLVSVGQDCKIHFLDTQQRKLVKHCYRFAASCRGSSS
jgi:WD40 repeat protein